MNNTFAGLERGIGLGHDGLLPDCEYEGEGVSASHTNRSLPPPHHVQQHKLMEINTVDNTAETIQHCIQCSFPTLTGLLIG